MRKELQAEFPCHRYPMPALSIEKENKTMTDYPNNIPAKLEIIKAMIDLSDSDKEILTKAASEFAVGMGGMEATLDFAKWFDYGTDAKGQKKSRSSF